jgi:hypothetical protein
MSQGRSVAKEKLNQADLTAVLRAGGDGRFRGGTTFLYCRKQLCTLL